MKVPFNKPVQLPESLDALVKAASSVQLGGDGPFGKLCEKLLEEKLGRPTRLTTSATHSMEMMALLLEVRPGDEIILPSFTFVSTANAFALRGAKLRFADNDLRGNVLPSEVERLRTRKTKAVMAMHYAGGSADIDELSAICGRYDLLLLEDAAQAIGSTYKGKPLGAIGDLGCFSFHDTKNVTSGEGGCLVFGARCESSKFLSSAEILREKGTNRSQFLQGLVDKYTWVGVGSSYVLSELNSAYLFPQLGQLEGITKQRRKIWERYKKELGSVLGKRGAEILEVASFNESNAHIFALLFSGENERNRFIAFMKERGVTCPFHYGSLHTSPIGITYYEGTPEHLPGAERLSKCLVRLPIYFNMTELEQAYVIEQAKTFFS